jgi:general secretion pathway protein I
MVAVAIIAIACTAVLGSQSQSVSLASEAKFYTTAALLAQHKMAEIEMKKGEEAISDSGDFGEDFPGYSWRLDVQEPASVEPEGVSTYLRQLDLIISWGDQERYLYRLRYFAFFPPRGG